MTEADFYRMKGELDSLRKLAGHVRRMRLTAPVEDDFPQVMHCLQRHYDWHVKLYGEPMQYITADDIT